MKNDSEYRRGYAAGMADARDVAFAAAAREYMEKASDDATKNLILKGENAELRAALGRIADYDAAEAFGYLNEWAEAQAFDAVQEIARKALAVQNADGEEGGG